MTEDGTDGLPPTETTQGAIAKLITLLVGNEKTRSIFLSLLTVVAGAWGVGHEVGWWGLMDGPIERLNRVKTPQYFGIDPDVREVLIETDRDHFECRVYSTGDAVAIRRTLRPDNSVYQQYRWLTPEAPDKTSRAIYRNLLAETAYAAEGPAPGKLKPDWKDKLLEALDDCAAKVQRVYPDGCWKILRVNLCTGDIEEVLLQGCG